METTKNLSQIKHRGFFGQTAIYLGKQFRMFIFKEDWQVIPMSAIIAALVAFVACGNMFKTMEGTGFGSLALSCICIWNGFFNSVQSICRERDIVKREHRAGLHISAYVFSHMIYQFIICAIQSVITVYICYVAGLQFPTKGIIFNSIFIDIGITLFLLTYTADMISLAISSIAKNTTSAMTIMPFMLIFQLLFSGSVFKLGDNLKKFTDLSIAKWGINCLCAQADFNSLPLVTVWNQIFKFKNIDFEGYTPISSAVTLMEENNMVDEFCQKMGSYSPNADYVSSVGNVANCWLNLLIFTLIAVLISVLSLELIDKDKR